MAAKSNLVDVGDGIRIPGTISAVEVFRGLTVDLAATYDPEVGRYRTTRLELRADDGVEITSELLRAVRVADLLRTAVRRIALPGRTAVPVAEGPTDETLRAVAVVYRIAVIVGDPPTQTVAAELDVTRSTAARWVTRARDRGLLTVVDKRARTVS